jgi:N-acetylneuraminate synthase
MGIYTIAEIGINHNGDIDIAKRMINLAQAAGWDAVKFQKRTPALCVPAAMRDTRKSTPWGEMSYIEYKERIELGYEEYNQIRDHCEHVGISWFASVWDLPSAEFMTEFCDMVKIPSAAITNLELLEYCRDHFPKRVMSTGMSDEAQIDEAVGVFDPFIIMHCNAAYPSPPEALRLNYIQWLRRKYPDRVIGYSGHEYGVETTYAAVALGARVIERHITLDHDMWGSDQKCSVGPEGMFKIVRGVKNCLHALGGDCARGVDVSELEKMEALRCV